MRNLDNLSEGFVRPKSPLDWQFDSRALGFTLLTLMLSLQASYAAPLLLLVHTAYVLLGLEAVRVSQRHPLNPWLFSLRIGYVAFVPIVSFVQVADLQGELYRSYWLTQPLVSFEFAMFGVSPPLWVSKLYTPVLTEVMSFLHLSLYFMPLVFAVPLIRGKHFGAVVSGTGVVLFTYIVNYVLFLFLPALNPRNSPSIAPLYVPPVEGYLFWDHAKVRDLDRLFVVDQSNHLDSVGGGARVAFNRFTLDAALAVPLTRVGIFDEKPDPRVLVSLTTRLWPWSYR